MKKFSNVMASTYSMRLPHSVSSSFHRQLVIEIRTAWNGALKQFTFLTYNTHEERGVLVVEH